jgi:hypothetical protein
MVWWVPLAAMAANILSKDKAARDAERLAGDQAQLDIAETRAAQLGSVKAPYGRIVNNFAVEGSARARDRQNQLDDIGSAIQAVDGAMSSKSSADSLQALQDRGADLSSRGSQMDLDSNNYSLLAEPGKQSEIFTPRPTDPQGGFGLQEDDWGLLSGPKNDLYKRFRL